MSWPLVIATIISTVSLTLSIEGLLETRRRRKDRERARINE